MSTFCTYTHAAYFCSYASSYAQVSIKLRNRGHDAYKAKEYGQSITVERRITSDGSGSYRLKSHDGRLHKAVKAVPE